MSFWNWLKAFFVPGLEAPANVMPIRKPDPPPILSASPAPSEPKAPDLGVVIVGKELEVDIFHGDGDINFEAMFQEGKVKRLYVKASQFHIDESCQKYVKAAHAAGFRKIGCYHFMSSKSSAGLSAADYGKKQGQMFLEAINGIEGLLTLPHCLDWEEGSAEGTTSLHQQEVADNFFAVVEATMKDGVSCEIYGGESFLRDLKLPAKYARHPLWLAHYQTVITHLHIPAPWTKLEGWQYSDHEVVAGLAHGHRGIDASWIAA